MIAYNQKQLRDLTFSSSREWLLTDGEGGFSSSTVSFMNTRRQHSLLTLSLNPPLKRLTILNKVDEEVIIDGKSYFLGSNHYPDAVFPEGYKLLSKFTFDYFPQVSYDLSGCHVSKSILMPKRSSSIFIHYENQSKKALTLRLLPLVSFRFKDSIRKSDESFLVDELPDGIRIIADVNLPRLYLKLSQMYNTSPESRWYYDFIYPHDSNLYKDEREDLFNMGYWETELEPEKSVTLAASIRDLGEFDYTEIKSRYIEAADKIRTITDLPKKYSNLANSASNHLVRNSVLRTPTVIGGYPYGGVNITETLMTLDGISYTTESQNFDQEFLHELASNEMNGSFPSSADEETLQIGYNNPRIPLYFAFALARHAKKKESLENVRHYLPLLEGAIEIIMTDHLGGSTLKDSGLLDLGNDDPASVSWSVNNAFVNAIWYNLLKLVNDIKSATESFSVYSETTSRIAGTYYDFFFETDGNYKNAGERNEMNFEMAIPLIAPHSPLNEEQKAKICRMLVTKFLDSYANKGTHVSPHHSCNLAAMYLLEASSQLNGCEKEFGSMKWYIEKLFTLQEFTICVDGLPKCGNSAFEYPQNISSSMVTAEAIRLIKKLKLR